jgi:hypothetical protein
MRTLILLAGLLLAGCAAPKTYDSVCVVIAEGMMACKTIAAEE